MKVKFTSKDPYRNDARSVRIRMYTDDQWSAFKSEPSCAEKVPHATQSEQVLMTANRGKGYVAEAAFTMDNSDKERALSGVEAPVVEEVVVSKLVEGEYSEAPSPCECHGQGES